MKLRNKLLTALPVCVIGLSAPIAVSSCSCKKSSLSFNFGDGINCKDKNTSSPAYHTFSEIKSAVKNNIEIAAEGTVAQQSELLQWNEVPSKNQSLYWDIINSCAWCSFPFIMTGDWTKSKDTFELVFNGNVYKSLKYDRNNIDGGKSIFIYGVKSDGTPEKIIGSYRYQFVRFNN